MPFDGVDVRGSLDLQHLVPAGPPESALAPGALVPCACLGILDDRCPGRHRIAVHPLRRSPQIRQDAADVRVLDADRAVQIPREGHSPLTPSRFLGREPVLEFRVVGGLHLPGHDPVLDEDHPATATRAVDTVCAAHGLVILPAIAVELLPEPGLGIHNVLDPAHLLPPIRGSRTSRRRPRHMAPAKAIRRTVPTNPVIRNSTRLPPRAASC